MRSDLTLFSPAKLNIHLAVKEKRIDGFHSIESIFQTISLYDKMDFKMIEEQECRLLVEGMCLEPKNTLTQAYEAFRALTGIKKGVEVFVQKRIPAGAGLGGGSSNAASLILCMDKIFETNLEESAILKIASKVGSDVPFFIKGGAAIVTGRGEIIRPIKQRDDLFFVLIFPEVHSSTKEAYTLLDRESEQGYVQAGPLLGELEELYYKSPDSWTFINSFSNFVLSQQSAVKQAFTDIEGEDALYVQMSGSGSSVFGVFLSEIIAQKAYENLSKKWKRSYILTSSAVDCC